MLKGRSALITGSTQGLGYAMASRLAAEGCNVMLNGFGDAAEIEARRRDVETRHGVRALHHGADIGEAAQVAALVEAAIAAFGAVDILINNAVVRHFAPLEQFRSEDWERALAVNLSAAFHTSRLVLPGMRARDFGRIINISSIFGLRGAVNRVDYVTTKTALIGFTRAVALETAGQNITCNAICPGSSSTPAIEQRLAEFMAREKLSHDEAVKAFMASRQPSGRFVEPDRVAGLAVFLCGPDGRDVTGAALSVDGGWAAS
ncbi:3-hydroxybutyrate dehydrogenase [Enhydrobacter aerosaccus]|uniref:3-hydroxybutyrate dehydrogenase n=1 Tax=Enhydrobacter aerosaccus TaxID=225324 RepID=A0A1T4LP89_9HYPH|nr:3-hydroxybutyrate dehydrogenase [Enhydrobacter aerosaccus]SJZ56338.1 3-hydroxybutyrate dehydrogenase [Enhydrobacter aerosaccus]